jgi:predicted RNA-binding Zn-ribbon protein involved in translation (DUF1610 family)
MRFSKNDGQGEVEIDHQASPGLPPQAARQYGYDPIDVGEGTVYRAASQYCPHCGSHVILNPARIRARSLCFKCNSYICDLCHAASRDPDYQHVTFMEIVDKVKSGKFAVVGETMSTRRLVPIGGNNG